MALSPNALFGFFDKDPKYSTTLAMLKILQRDFPKKFAGLLNQPERMAEWKKKIDSGARSDDQTRDDIAKHIIGEELLMETYGLTAEEAQGLILGGNEGGTNFSDLSPDQLPGAVVDVGGGVDTKKGVPKEENIAEEGVGGKGPDEDTQLTILTGKEMKWFFDPSTGKWYVEYGLPGTDRSVIFEADPDQMDALFGTGQRPVDFERKTLKELTQRPLTTFAGNVSQMSGTGTFEGEVERVIALALDEGVLPEWALKDGEAMGIIFVAQSENKSDDWVLNQLSKTKGFKERFPEIGKFKDDNNLTLVEAITGFLEMEAGVNQALKATGQEGSADPATIGALLAAGHSLKTLQDTITGFARLEKFAPAMDAFNKVLAAHGLAPIVSIQDMLDFVSGKASSEIYDLYEASSITEAAIAAGLGDVFSVEDAIDLANATDQTLQSATQGMQKAAELLLRLRHEVNVGKFGLDHEELLDISLGQTPRSGRPASEILESINRAVAAAQGRLQKRATPFRSFSSEGQPQAASLRGLRQES